MEANSQSLPHGYALQGEKNRYVIDRVLGQGAFGITYLARYRTTIQGSMGRGTGWMQVAVKEFFMRDLNTRDESTCFLNDTSQDGLIGRYRRAFMREARNLASLHHPNIVNVFEVIETNNTVYIVMEYINGGSLDEHINQAGHLSQEESIDSMLKLCSAVGFMHERKMLHLDIKPKNVMLDEDGNLYLIDFGLSKQFNADGEPESSTTIGLGTPGYAPLEQVEHHEGEKKFPATLDIYALGATLYKMLTGSTPPRASQVSDSAWNGDNIIPRHLKESGVSGSISAIVTKAMFPSSSKRYQTVQELEMALMEIIESTSDRLPVPNPVSPVPVPNPVPPVQTPNPTPVPAPNPVPDTGKDKEPVYPNPNPGSGPKPGFPKWLYVVIAAIVVGLIVLFAIPKSKPTLTPDPTTTSTPEPVKEEVVMPAPTPTHSPAPTPTTTSKPEEAKPEEPKTVALTSISLNKTSLTLEEGETSTLTVSYKSSNASDKITTWKSTNTKIATVNSSGKVSAVNAGEAEIIATCGGKEVRCSLLVTSKRRNLFIENTSLTNSFSLYAEGDPRNNINVVIIKIFQDVDGATIWLDGVKENKAGYGGSFQFEFYEPGVHTFKITLEGYKDFIFSDTVKIGYATYIDVYLSSIGNENGHEYVDLGLSVKWATCNVGASVPWDYGDYYAWGEISTKNDYSWSTYKYCKEGDYHKLTKYCNDSGYGNNGFTDGKTKLELSDDVARQKWGGSWRMPTEEEFQELIDNCTWTWTTQNGVNGYKVTSKKSGYTSRSIFLPAALYRDGTSLSDARSHGNYWSSSLYSDANSVLFLFFNSDYHDIGTSIGDNRVYGQSVRPVCP